MKQNLILLIGIFTSIVYADTKIDNLDIKNECKGLKLLEVKFYPRKDYTGKEDIYGFDYALKNTTDKALTKIRLTVYLKDKEGHRISEHSFGERELKAHYEKPINKGTYYSIDNLPSDFFGVADLEITCNNAESKNKAKEEKNISKFTDIKIPTKLYESIKQKTKSKSDFETRIEILLILANSLK